MNTTTTTTATATTTKEIYFSLGEYDFENWLKIHRLKDKPAELWQGYGSKKDEFLLCSLTEDNLSILRAECPDVEMFFVNVSKEEATHIAHKALNGDRENFFGITEVIDAFSGEDLGSCYWTLYPIGVDIPVEGTISYYKKIQ